MDKRAPSGRSTSRLQIRKHSVPKATGGFLRGNGVMIRALSFQTEAPCYRIISPLPLKRRSFGSFSAAVGRKWTPLLTSVTFQPKQTTPLLRNGGYPPRTQNRLFYQLSINYTTKHPHCQTFLCKSSSVHKKFTYISLSFFGQALPKLSIIWYNIFRQKMQLMYGYCPHICFCGVFWLN